MGQHLELVKLSVPQKSHQLPYFTTDGWMIIFAVFMIIGFAFGFLVGDWQNEIVSQAAGK